MQLPDYSHLPVLEIEDTFFVPRGSKVNWDATDCNEGLQIPNSFLRGLKDRYSKFLVKTTKRGVIYLGCKKDVLDHHEKWNTYKTAPENCRRLSKIVPVNLLQEIGITEERIRKVQQARMDRARAAREEARKEKQKPQLAIF